MLTDSFGRSHTYLRISLTERCNLRCKYCMPAEGVPLSPRDDILTFEEIERLARLFARNGVNKIRLTGGEPLVRKDVENVVERIGLIPEIETLAITTNGLLLERKLANLVASGVNLLNISLDTLREDRFEAITRRKGLDKVLKAIDAAVASGISKVKVNAVVMKGVNDDELIDFVRLTEQRPIEVRFIEYMPFAGNSWQDASFVSFRSMREKIERRYKLTALDDGPNETARTFKVPKFAGTIGFIASMSEPFCEGCNRLRITADGNLKVCLFGPAEVSLRDVMRKEASDEKLGEVIREAVLRKKARHAGMYNLVDLENRPMILIGG